MRGLGSGKDHYTKYGGQDKGKYDKVKKEDNLKDQRDDGENLPKNAVANAKRKVHRKGDDYGPG